MEAEEPADSGGLTEKWAAMLRDWEANSSVRMSQARNLIGVCVCAYTAIVLR